MCGFAGMLARDSAADHARATVRRMTDAIVHRGPDDDGVWSDDDAGIHLGFRRLAIIDLSSLGHQPMTSASGRFVIVFNGEVFNHGELRAELLRDGVQFRGRSDTEVLLAAFERWGITAAVPRFVGMFAIAVWDRESRALTLVRDRLGIKPLYVHRRAGAVTFGSELKALMADERFDRTIDPMAVTEYLRQLYVAAPRSVFANAIKLRPGHMLTVHDPHAPLPASVPYWSLEQVAHEGLADPIGGSREEVLDEFDRRLVESVRLRMEADVPLGALLSGGIDSSAVVAVMQEASSRPVKTFCVGFDVAEHDEAHHAARVARHIGTDHTEVRLDGRDALETVPRIAEIFDEPHADAAQLPALLVCGVARKHVTVALSGDGGDELLGGYNRYTFGTSVLERAERVPRPARRLLAAGIGSLSARSWARAHGTVASVLPPAMRHRLAGEKVLKLGRLMESDSQAGMYQSLLSAWQRPSQLVVGGSEDQETLHRVFGATGPSSLLDRMMLLDQLTSLPDDHLAKVDRVSMATSLEMRVPLLDHRLVEFSWRLPTEYKIAAGRGKVALRESLYRRVPRELIDRPKMGFSVPLAPWLRGPLRPWAEELLSERQVAEGGLLNAQPVRRAWAALQRGHDEHALALWAVLMLQAWRARWSN